MWIASPFSKDAYWVTDISVARNKYANFYAAVCDESFSSKPDIWKSTTERHTGNNKPADPDPHEVLDASLIQNNFRFVFIIAINFNN